MTISQELLNGFQEKFEKVGKLMSEDRKPYPINEPFTSKYAARKMLLEIKPEVANQLNTAQQNSDDYFRFLAMLAHVDLYLGVISYNVDEVSTCVTYFEQCKQLIGKYECRQELILVAVMLYNQLGILWWQREPEKSKFHLEKAVQLYKSFVSTSQSPVEVCGLFAMWGFDSASMSICLEENHTLTLYYMAQVYGVLKETLKSAIYCHSTLQRQLELNNYDSIDWALNAATLSQVFMEKNSFKQARHHLAASSFILDEYKKELDSINERDDSYLSKVEVFNHRSADVARCWAKYGLVLLSKSKERLLDQANRDDGDIGEQFNSNFNNLSLKSVCPFGNVETSEFKRLDLTVYENQIVCDYLLTIDDARKVFLNIQHWLGKAKNYYTLDTLASDHIQIVQDQSQMYLNFLFFEDNAENQAKLHKRRIDLLENIVEKINPQYYLYYCLEIWWELSDIYSEILNIKCDKLRECGERPMAHALQKINNLIGKSLHYNGMFIKTVKNGYLDEEDTRIEEDLEKQVLLVHFHIAVLSSRFITLDKHKQLENVEASLAAYKKVHLYCKRHNKAKELIAAEAGICDEMVILLPVKIGKLRQELP